MKTQSPMPPLLPGPIGFLLIPQFAVLALASAIEPLRIANRYLEVPYTWKLLSLDGQAVEDDNGILIQPKGCIYDEAELGTLIICADIQPDAYYSAKLQKYLQQMNARGASLGALDTGCFMLAQAGLLEHTTVTMHWEVLDAFQERFRTIAVRQTLFEVGARRLTCAGGTAAIDMMLSAIANDHGKDLAARVAEHCLHDQMRPGDAVQRNTLMLKQSVQHPALAQALQFLEKNPERVVTVPELALQVGVSSRQLIRLFVQIVGEGPARYHRRLRLEHARSLLRNTSLPVTEVAVASGFESLAHFCRAYHHHFGQAPGADRRSAVQPRPLARDKSH